MTTCLGKSCPFGLPRVPFVNCCQFMYLVISLFGFEGRICDLIVSVPDHCLSFYFEDPFSSHGGQSFRTVSCLYQVSSFFVSCFRGSTIGFLLLKCSNGVVRHPRDLQVK